MSDCRIRRIVANDGPDLVRLWRQTWAATYGASLGREAADDMLAELDRNGLLLMMPGQGEEGLCATVADKIVGSVLFRRNGDVLYLWGMYVLPEMQRRRIGASLLRSVFDRLDGDVRIQLLVLKSSGHAVRFYQAHGFAIVGEEAVDLPGAAPLPSWIMSLDARRNPSDARPSGERRSPGRA